MSSATTRRFSPQASLIAWLGCLSLAPLAAHAAVVNFDNLPSGSVLTTQVAGVSFREPLSGGGVPIMVGSFGGGNQVLSVGGDIAFNATQGAIDISFSTPQRSVSVSAAAHREGWYIGHALNRPFMEVYDASGTVLGRVLYQGPLPSSSATMPFETLNFVSSSANIARIRLSSQASQGGSPIDGIFDNLAFSQSAIASALLYDDFSSARRDRWTTSSGGNGMVSAVSGGALRVEVARSLQGADIFQRWDGTCQLSGDFDLQVDYEMTGSRTGVRAALAAWGAGHMERSSLSKTDIYTVGEYYITNISGYVPGFVPTTDKTGGLRLVRNGKLMSSYHRSGSHGAWKPYYTQYVTTADLPFGLQVWTHDWAYARQGATVSFDNLLLASGRFTGKGCPQ